MAKRQTRLKIGSTLEKRRYIPCTHCGGTLGALVCSGCGKSNLHAPAMLQTRDLPAGSVYKLVEIKHGESGTQYVIVLASGKTNTRHTISGDCLPAFNLTKPYTNVPRYGMAWHTIRYHQTQARDLYRFNGIYAGRSILESSTAKLDTMNPRDIGHAAIQLAQHASTEHMIAVLTQTRGARWKY